MAITEAAPFYSAIAALLALLAVKCVSKRLFKALYRPVMVAALVLESVAIGVRWSHTGHPPIFGTFEETLAATWIIILFAIMLDKRGGFAHLSIPIVMITFLYGLNFDTTPTPLTISEQSYWVDFHALFAWIAYGFYMFSFLSALCILLNNVCGENVGQERFLYACLLWGFLAQTISFVLGSYYSTLLHGAWWMWDPVEYLFIVSWFLYAIPVHGRLLFNWEPRKLAGFTAAAMAGTLLLYWGLVYIPWATYHIFDTDLKIIHA